MPTRRVCPHGRSDNGRHCRKCWRSEAHCSHGAKTRRTPGYRPCRHGFEKRFCFQGAIDSSCGKDVCKEHRQLKKKCKICQGWATLAAEMLASPEFDVAPWQLEEAEALLETEEKQKSKRPRLDFDSVADE